MTLGHRWARFYLDWVYTPVYDLTVARLTPYRRFQGECLDRLGLREGDAILSIGVGTGNEVVRLLERYRSQGFSLLGVDPCRPALVRAYGKARRRGKEMGVLLMDAQRLGFRDGCFDRVLCLHTMFFLEDNHRATQELLRVLKGGGSFVVTYPAGRGGWGLVREVVMAILGNLRRGRVGEAVQEAVAALGAALAYFPVAPWLKPKGGFLSRPDLERMLTSLEVREYTIEEDGAYQELIVWGRK